MYTKIRDEKLEALEEIEDRTFRGDNAVGFVTFNGLPIVKHYLLSNDFEMASECFRLLGNIVSNQPFCQQKAIEYNLIPIAIEALNNHTLYSIYPCRLSNHHYTISNKCNRKCKTYNNRC
eukprot:UN10520